MSDDNQTSLESFGATASGSSSVAASSSPSASSGSAFPADPSHSPPSRPQLGFETPPPLDAVSSTIAEARRTDWIVNTGRYPYVFDAARFGYAIGHREDSSYQWTPDEVSLPVHFLDNNYRDSDLDRFVDRIFELSPEIAVIGDIYDPDSLDAHLAAAEEVWASYPEIELIIVPKSPDIIDDLPDRFILGYPNGTSDVQALDIASHSEWRSFPHRLHILGGTPLSTYRHIVQLTRETITETPPADIAGLDWNGYQLYAESYGDYANAEGGWHQNLREEYASTRDLLCYSLLNAKHFWAARGIWPTDNSTTLPARDTLMQSLRGGPVQLDEASDARELLLSPPTHIDRTESPLFRTDETLTEIVEPLSPIAGKLIDPTWDPDGSLTGATTYTKPTAHSADPVCVGCGRSLFARNDPSDTEDRTVQFVSYEHQTASSPSNHYESVVADGPSNLAFGSPHSALYHFCSDLCRDRAEYESPHMLLDKPHSEAAHPDPNIIAELTLSLE